MRVNTAELATLRTYPHRTRYHLGVERGTTLLTAQVNGTQIEGATNILLKNVVGDPTNLVKGMTVAIHSLLTNDRVVTAVFISYNSGTMTLTIGPNAETAFNDQYVTIYSAMKLWRLIPPAFDIQHIPPFAIIGPPRAGFVDEPIKFVGANSYSPIGRTLNTPRWHIFQDGFISGGDTAQFNSVTVPLIVSFPTAGEKLIRFTCRDSTTELATTYRPILIFDRTGPNAPYEEVKVNSMQGRAGAGWSASFTVYGEANPDAFPPQALVVFWVEDWYGDEQVSVGGCLRGYGETLFSGWVREGSVTVNSDEQSVTFTADSVDLLLDRLTMPDYTFRDGDDSTNWFTFNNLTLGKASLHIIQQETTLSQMCDVFHATFNYQLDILDIPSSELLKQLQQSILPACFGYSAGSRYASFTLARNRNAIDPTQRGYLKRAAITFTADDWMNLEVGEERFASTAQVRLEGRLGDDMPISAEYPFTGPANAGAIKIISGLFFKNQAQADELVETIWKSDNRRINRVSLKLANYRILEPAFQEYFTIYLPDSQNNRGYNFVGTINGVQGREFFTEAVSFQFEEGAILVNVEGRASIYGPAGTNWMPISPTPTLENVPGYDQNPNDDLTGTDGVL